MGQYTEDILRLSKMTKKGGEKWVSARVYFG